MISLKLVVKKLLCFNKIKLINLHKNIQNKKLFLMQR